MMRLRVRLTPGSNRDAIEGWIDHLSERVLKARVSAPPEGGKANAALIALLAKSLRMAKTNIRIASGESSRLKTIEIATSTERDASEIAARLATIGEMP